MGKLHHDEYDDDPWREVRLTKVAIRARAKLILFSALLSLPYVALVAAGVHLSGLMPNEVMGVACYHAMISTLYCFDTLRNAAHDCFDQALEDGLVMIDEGIPIVDRSYPHHSLASLSFAIGGRLHREQA